MNSAQVPVFDIRALSDAAATLRELDEARREWGFFQIVGHGIPAPLLAAAHAQMPFFALPDSVKQSIARTSTNEWGFYERGPTKNRRDAAPHHRLIHWGEFRAGRAVGDYAAVGAEIQIADFRVESP